MVCDTIISDGYARVLWYVTQLFQMVMQGCYGV